MLRAYVVYILRCNDESYYTGVTNDLLRRLEEHVWGINDGCYTSDRRPVQLVYSLSFGDIHDAIHFEKVVKAWNRKKKEALINHDPEALRRYSKKKFPVRYERKNAGFRLCRLQYELFLVRSRLQRELLGMTNVLREECLDTLSAPH